MKDNSGVEKNIFKKHFYKKVWASIGFVVNLSQMIEYNLANILGLNEILSAFDKQATMEPIEYKKVVEAAEKWYKWLSKKELGKLKQQLIEKNIFSKEFVNEIDHVREERNYFVHEIFKDDLFSREFQNNPKQYIPRLQELVYRLNDLNESLCKIFDRMKKEVKMIY